MERLPGLLNVDDLVLVLCGECVEVCRRRGLKVDADKRRGKVLDRKEGLVCEGLLDGTRLEHVSKFKYLGGMSWRNHV